MTAESPWARIIIVNYNAGPLLQACVDALASQTMPAFEAVIVDNASKIEPISTLRLPDGRFRILASEENLGFAAGTNLGARGSRCPWLVSLNPDAFPKPDWLAELRAATERYPGTRVFGSTQLSADSPEIVDGFGDVLPAFGSAWRSGNSHPVSSLPKGDCEVFSPCAAAALYAREAFESVGGFDERFYCYLEDVDLGFRLRLAGERCVQVRRAEVLHVGSALTRKMGGFSIFYSYRNRLWLFARNTPGLLLAPVFGLQLLSIALSIAFSAKMPLEIKRAALAGAWAGLKGLAGMMQSRKAIQRGRVLSAWEVARLLVWNPFKNRPPGRVTFIKALS